MSSDKESSAQSLILDYFNRNPIKLSPWKIAQFFEDETNISEEFLDKSLDKLAEIAPDFEETHRELIEELEKVTLLAVPMFRKLQLITILSIVREATTSHQVFQFLPDFPKSPASRLLDHIFRDETLSQEEKKSGFEKIAKSTPKVLAHLVSWRDHVAKYMKGLEEFQKEYEGEMSDGQREHLKLLIERSKKTIPQIDLKIEQKKIATADEIREFEQFFNVVSKEPKYSDLDEDDARTQIQQIFDDSDHDLRRIIARMGKEIKQEYGDFGSGNGNVKIEESEESGESGESGESEKEKNSRKRPLNLKTEGSFLNPANLPSHLKTSKRLKTTSSTGILKESSDRTGRNDEKVSDLKSES